MEPRDGVSIPFPNTWDQRPGVVIEVFPEDGSAIVVMGTKRQHPELEGGLIVDRSHPAYKRLALDVTTYFYPTNTRIIPLDLLARRGSCWEHETFQDIREVAMRGYHHYAERGEDLPGIGYDDEGEAAG